MVSRKDIQATCDDIVREFAPHHLGVHGKLILQYYQNMQWTSDM